VKRKGRGERGFSCGGTDQGAKGVVGDSINEIER